MPVLDLMFIVAWSVMLGAGIGLIFFGASQVRNRIGDFEVEENRVAASGGIAGGVACLVIGALMITGATTLAAQAGF